MLEWAWNGIRDVFLYLFFVGVLCAVFFFEDPIFGCKERDIRLIGLGLQITGFLSVASQLTNISRLFNNPSVLSRVINRLKSLPSPYIKDVLLEAQIMSGSASIYEASARVRHNRNATLVERLKILENSLDSFEENLQKVRNDLRDFRTEIQQSLEETYEKIRKELATVENLVNEAVGGGVHIQWVSIIHFLTGVVLATTAPELSAWLGFGGQCGQ